MKQIPLTNRDFSVLISDEDYSYLSQFKWFAKESRSGEYACTSVRVDERVFTLRMHRLIADCPDEYTVDHMSRNHFDNRRENLEIVTMEENIRRYYDLAGNEVYKDTVPF